MRLRIWVAERSEGRQERKTEGGARESGGGEFIVCTDKERREGEKMVGRGMEEREVVSNQGDREKKRSEEKEGGDTRGGSEGGSKRGSGWCLGVSMKGTLTADLRRLLTTTSI